MYLLKDNKLYAYQNGVYKSVDIIDCEIIFNGVETKPNAREGQLLTHKEVYCKFHINPNEPRLSKSYHFPRLEEPKEEVVNEAKEEPVPKVVPKPRSSNK